MKLRYFWLITLSIFSSSAMDEIDQNWPRIVDQLEAGLIPVEEGKKEQLIEWFRRATPSERIDGVISQLIGSDRLEVVKWKNTLLTPETWPIGIYNGDIIELIKTLWTIAAANITRTMLLKKRINYIYESLLSDHHEVSSLIEVIERGKNKWEQQFFAKPDWQMRGHDLFVRTAQVNPLINYAQEHHRLIGKVPISSSLFVPLVSYYLAQKGSDMLFDTFEPTSSTEWCITQCTAFKQAPDGRKKLTKKRPASIIDKALWLIRFAYNPFNAIQITRLRYRLAVNKLLYFSSPISLPSALQGRIGHAAYDFAGLSFGAQLFDSWYHHNWTIFLIKHRLELYQLLKNYQEAISAGRSLDPAKLALKQFIERGHRDKGTLPGSMLGTWWQTLSQGQSKFKTYINYGLLAGIIGKVAWTLLQHTLLSSNKGTSS